MQPTDDEPQRPLLHEPSFVVEDGNRKRYKLKEVYRAYPPADECQGTGKCIGSDGQPVDPPTLTAYPGKPTPAAGATFSELPTIMDSVLRAQNTSGGQPVIQYNTYNIYQSDAKQLPQLEHKPEAQVDKLIFAFIIILLVVVVSFSAIIFLILVRFAKKDKRKKKAEEKCVTEFDHGFEESQTISTSEVGFLPRHSRKHIDQSSRSAAAPNSDLNFFTSKRKEASNKSKRSNQSQNRFRQAKDEDDSVELPTLGKQSTSVSDSRPLDSIDFGHHLRSRFGEKVTSAIPELSRGLEHSKSFLTSPDLPDYENGRFRNNFYAIKEIGKGSFGCVYRAFHKLEEKVYAIKCIEFQIPDGQDPRMDSTLREIYAMSDLKHENVVRYITCWMEKEENEESEPESMEPFGQQTGFGKKTTLCSEVLVEEPPIFSTPEIQPIMARQGSGFEIEFGCLSPEDKKGGDSSISEGCQERPKLVTISLYIQMEFCKGLSLSACLDTDQFRLTVVDVYCIFSQVVDGLAYIHSKGLIHRDIKPGNIFVETTGMLKIGDFGLVMHDNKVVSTPSMDTVTTSQVHLKKKFDKTRQPEGDETEFAGSPLYAPPEASDGEPICDPSGDVYATGVVLFELLGNFKTRHKKIQEIMALKKAKRTCDSFRQRHPFEARVIDSLIVHDPARRPKASEVKGRDEYRQWTAHIQAQISTKNTS